MKKKKSPKLPPDVIRCSYCKDLFKVNDLIQWEDDDGARSPFVCAECYDYMLEHYDGDLI